MKNQEAAVAVAAAAAAAAADAVLARFKYAAERKDLTNVKDVTKRKAAASHKNFALFKYHANLLNAKNALANQQKLLCAIMLR